MPSLRNKIEALSAIVDAMNAQPAGECECDVCLVTIDDAGGAVCENCGRGCESRAAEATFPLDVLPRAPDPLDDL
jgi:hypothetical protein